MPVLLAQLHDIQPPVRFASVPWLLLSLLIVLLLAVLALSLFWSRRRRTQKTTEEIRLAPIQMAREALKTLATEKDLTDRAFAYELTGIVRRYAEAAFRLPVTERTTEEMLDALQANPPFSPELAQRLGHLLQSTVLVRYAAQPFSEQQRQELLQEGANWVERAEQERQPAPAPAQPSSAA
ncbi:MAG: DUF4381 family protein [Verrucomicrobiota bacterium JB022]|nr:DUF4381 family protein [Verrucomicrobiota bacterium JB022]